MSSLTLTDPSFVSTNMHNTVFLFIYSIPQLIPAAKNPNMY